MNTRTYRIELLLFLLFLVYLSCNKPGNSDPASPNPTNPSPSDKNITSFVFKASNNSALTVDISGTIGTDSIKLILPSGTSLKNLVPTITFNGKSIQPSSNVSQDFSNVINYIVTAEDGSTKKYVVIVSLQALQGTIFITSFFNVIDRYPSDRGAVYAIDANNGSVRWKYTMSGFGSTSNPAFSKGILYTGNDDKVLALDTATKIAKWEFKAGNFIAKAIEVANDIVYANCSDGYLYAIDANTGNLKWKFGRDSDPLSPNIFLVGSSPTIVNGVLYFGRSKYVYALDAFTGSIKWKWEDPFTSRAEINTNPCVDNNVIYIGDLGGNMVALNAQDGTLKWSYILDNIPSSATVVNGVVYVEATNNLYALDASTGNLKWKYYSALLFTGSPTVASGVVYCTAGGGNSGLLYAINAVNGSEKWRYFYDLSDIYAPIVFNDNVLFTLDFNLVSIDANTGKLRWMFTSATPTREIFSYSPCVVDEKGNVYYSSESGN